MTFVIRNCTNRKVVFSMYSRCLPPFASYRTIIKLMENLDNANKQYIKMTQTPVSTLILTLGLPTVISMLISSIYNMADTYFVGTLGTSASGATGIVFGLMSILQAFGFMFGHGAGANIARKLGSHDIKSAKIYASTSFWCSILVGLVIMLLGFTFMEPFMRLLGSTDTILPYAKQYATFILIAGPALTSSCVMNNILRYEGKAFFAMIGLTLGGILNIFGDYLFINIYSMGIAGAGLSTAISEYISMFVLMIPYLRKQTQSSFLIKDFSRKLYIYKDIYKTGLPSLFRQGLNSVSTMVLNGTAGLYGDAAVAAISIVTRIVNFLFCIAIGIGQGFQPVCAFNYGAKFYSRVKAGFIFALKLGSALMICSALLAYFNSELLVSLFRDDKEVIAIGSTCLKWYSISLILMPITLYGNMLFQSIGQTRAATFLAAVRSGLILIPTIYIINMLFGLSGLEKAQSISEIIAAIISLPFIYYFFKNQPKDGQEAY